MKINKNRTTEQALKYFEDGATMHRSIDDPIMTEVWAEASVWKIKNVAYNQRKDYPLIEVARSLIMGEL